MLARYALCGLGGAQDIEAGRRWYAKAISLGAPGVANELATLDQAMAPVSRAAGS